MSLKPFVSVSCICDAGHRVVFLRDGGCISTRRQDKEQSSLACLNLQCDKDFSKLGR